MKTTAKAQVREYQVRQVEAATGGQLELGTLRELVAAADKAKLGDGATVYVGDPTESSSQPGRWFVGTMLIQEIS